MYFSSSSDMEINMSESGTDKPFSHLETAVSLYSALQHVFVTKTAVNP
jgi:hypothetical protein